MDDVFILKAPNSESVPLGVEGLLPNDTSKSAFWALIGHAPPAASRAVLRAWRRSASNVLWSSRPGREATGPEGLMNADRQEEVGTCLPPCCRAPPRLYRLLHFHSHRSGPLWSALVRSGLLLHSLLPLAASNPSKPSSQLPAFHACTALHCMARLACDWLSTAVSPSRIAFPVDESVVGVPVRIPHLHLPAQSTCVSLPCSFAPEPT